MKISLSTAVLCLCLLGAMLAPVGAQTERSDREPAADRAHYILPPGNYGGIPTTDESRDQLPLYDGLTPLRDDIGAADIDRLFIPEDFEPVGATTEEPTGRPGVTIVYDEFGVAHVHGETRADVAFGAGWVSARDRGLLIQLGRGPARVAVADVPGINAFGLVTSGQSFVPSASTEALLDEQVELLIETYGEEGRQIIADAQAHADGINAYWTANGIDEEPATVNDVIAVTAFIGSIFGAGGGGEVGNAEFLRLLQDELGTDRGEQVWEDAMLFNDPEAPTSIRRRFDYGPLTGGRVEGSVLIDPGSVQSLDPRQPGGAPAPAAEAAEGTFPAAEAPPSRDASNFLVVDRNRSQTRNTLAVMGPQLGYYYPEIVQQIHLSGPGIEAQGVAVPGMAMYILIGRTTDYAWSLTSANHDVRDVFVEVLCEPDGSPASTTSEHYLFDDECRSFEMVEAGELNGTPLRYPVTVHGPVIGTATSEGQPVALSRKRSTFGRDALNLAALKDMTEGEAQRPRDFYRIANQFGFTFNWAYTSRSRTAFFSSGLLPKRARGLDRRLPTLGTGDYEWRGFLGERRHPHAARHAGGLLLNWNNKSAPGFMHGDTTEYGSIHRVQLFDQWERRVTLEDTVGVMNRSATEDTRSTVWPVISEVLRGGTAPTPLAAEVVALLDAWVADDAPRLDADDDGFNDHAGPTIFDDLFEPLVEAVMRPVYGQLVDELDDVNNLGGTTGASYVDKDLRTLLSQPVSGPFTFAYCGAGDLDACRQSLWAEVQAVADDLAADRGPDPTTWLKEGSRTGFVPGLITDTIRSTNRPTFQQVLELQRPGR
ncbi:MAG: penicillin acylase family protein, partial [Acidimicrobiia bacterium]|nr:penicillin acylase family protein [Acidimicrobiia bacterium]